MNLKSKPTSNSCEVSGSMFASPLNEAIVYPPTPPIATEFKLVNIEPNEADEPVSP